MTIVPPTSAFPVVVTGASRGIDAETAILLADRAHRERTGRGRSRRDTHRRGRALHHLRSVTVGSTGVC